ncbi:MAG: hypothetical protein JWR01_2879 [Subtercola sp.]|nr:hypothetical protein [Subtercola sp.]
MAFSDTHTLIKGLGSRIRGSVWQPDESGYRAAAPWNTSVPFHPAAVVDVLDAADVSAAVGFAAANGYQVAVQATGHGAIARFDDTLLIHTARLDECIVRPEEQLAVVGAGVTAQRLIDAAAEHGLASIVGSAGTVGVAGYLSGGGIGPLVSTFGLSSDHIVSLNVVTGDGKVRHVSPEEDPELFWAFRGGKSSLGIITSVTLRLVPLTHFYGGAIWFSGDDAPAVLGLWATWSLALPEEISTSIALMRAPAEGPPPAIAGRYVVAVRVGSVLSVEATETFLAPIRAAAAVILDSVALFGFRDIGRISDEPADPEPLVQDQALLSEFAAGAVDALLDAFTSQVGAPLAVAEVRRLGGALARTPEHPSAFSFRTAPFSLLAIGFAPLGETTPVADAATELLAHLDPRSENTILANFVATADPQRARLAYDEETRSRLGQLARIYDPHSILARRPKETT